MTTLKRLASRALDDDVEGALSLKRSRTGEWDGASAPVVEEASAAALLISGKRAANLDQFFTKPSVARKCIEYVIAEVGPLEAFECLLEPSAGAGAFFNLLPEDRRVGIDLDAAAGSPYIKQDYLKLPVPAFLPPLVTQAGRPVSLPRNPARVLVVGNPPFGKNAALAIEFVNHSLNFANTACFILPRTFNKASVQDRVDLRAHLVLSRDIESDAFLFKGDDYDVPCTFQIWSVRGPKRPKFKPVLSHPDFEFVGGGSSGAAGVFAVQRVGVHAGRVKSGEAKRGVSPSSHYFIKPRHARVVGHMRRADMANSRIKHQTAGNPSISKDELIAMYSQQLQAASGPEASNLSQRDCLCLSCQQS